MAEDGEPRLCDRSLATAVLYDQCPGGQDAAVVEALARMPDNLGRSYPANALWRCHALARRGRIDVVLREFRQVWSAMDSVRRNHTIQEFWQARPDSRDEWSHCAAAPLNVLFQDIAGIAPVSPGFGQVEIRPNLGDLSALELEAHTPRGPIRFQAAWADAGHQVVVDLPTGCQGRLIHADGLAAPGNSTPLPSGRSQFTLPAPPR